MLLLSIAMVRIGWVSAKDSYLGIWDLQWSPCWTVMRPLKDGAWWEEVNCFPLPYKLLNVISQIMFWRDQLFKNQKKKKWPATTTKAGLRRVLLYWLHVSPCGLPTYVNCPLYDSHSNCSLHLPSWIPSSLRFGIVFPQSSSISETILYRMKSLASWSFIHCFTRGWCLPLLFISEWSAHHHASMWLI